MSSHASRLSVSLLLLLLLPRSDALYLRDSNPLLSFNDQVRERHLYAGNDRQGLFLEMGADGSVKGTPERTPNSVLELRAVRAGETVIRGVSSSLYLCVDRTGRLRGQRLYQEADCTFEESLLANGYSLFLSKSHGHPVSLAPKPLPGKPFPPLSRFLPLRSLPSSGNEREERREEDVKPKQLDVDSEDPFGMGLPSPVRSPGFDGAD